MEEEVKDKKSDDSSLDLKKKYITTWRNKWITDKAGDIDDFIDTYEELAKMMKRWKSEGIILDPDIFGGVGDDYAQFCTYDEVIALKEGFEEEYFEAEEFGGKDFEELTVEFNINEYLSLKLVDDMIQIHVNGERFDQCRYLLIINPQDNEHQDEIESIDEVELLYQNDLESEVTPAELGITKEQEFWAHCSNLQAWVENHYDSRLLHRNLAFPLLKKLTEVGDQTAKKAFKDEIGVRFVRGYIPVMRYLFKEKYIDHLTSEEFFTLLSELDYPKLDLNLLLQNIDDYLPSKHGIQFLNRIEEEYSEFLRDNRLYVEFKTLKLDKSEISPTAFIPNSTFFIRGSNDGKIKMFDIMTGDLIRVFGDHESFVCNIAISREGKYVASCSDNNIKVWDFESGDLWFTFKGHEDGINSLIFAPDSNYLISGSIGFDMSECAIKVWDLDTRKLKRTLSSHWKEISSLAFSRDGNYLVSGAFDKTVNIWNTETGKLINTLVGHKRPVIGVGITNDKKKVISASFGNVIKIWDVASKSIINEIMIEKESGWKEGFDLISFVLSPNTKYIIGALQGDLKEGGLLKIWRIADGNLIQTLPIKQDFPGYYEELNEITISRNGSFIIATSRERMVKVWIDFLYYLGRIRLYQ